MSFCAFDIETGPLPGGESIKPWKNTRNLVKPNAIEADQQKHREKLSLHATTGHVLAVTYCTGPEHVLVETRWEFTEEELIRRAWDFFADFVELKKNRLVGWGILQFDMPYLVNRSFILELQLPGHLITGRHFNDKIIDLVDKWAAFRRPFFLSLDEACRSMGWDGKPDDAKNFHKWFEDDPQKAIDYCKWDGRHIWKMADTILRK